MYIYIYDSIIVVFCNTTRIVIVVRALVFADRPTLLFIYFSIVIVLVFFLFIRRDRYRKTQFRSPGRRFYRLSSFGFDLTHRIYLFINRIVQQL
jgi:hypothetical protein